MRVLVINSGSSSIKFSLYDMDSDSPLATGKLERIGETDSHSSFRHYPVIGNIKEFSRDTPVTDHAIGLQQIFSFLENECHSNLMESLNIIGHRVVHGGEIFHSPILINQDVIEGIRDTIPLAPLHNAANLVGIEITRRLYPTVPQVAIFDTAFYRNIPSRAYRYAIPNELYQQHNVRQYGFHGTSHQHIARQAAEYLHQPLNKLKLITLHLGNGASAAAIHRGICVDTSMGMTPLGGLVMGTRCGDLDPSVHFYLARKLGMSIDEIETLLNRDSGLKGLCGVNDMREVHRLADKGNEQARLAIEMYCYRICKYIGAYYVVLGGLDALIFSAGIGENDPIIRQLVCDNLSVLGILLDNDQNHISGNETTCISIDASKVKVLVIPSNEELEIARQAVATLPKTF